MWSKPAKIWSDFFQKDIDSCELTSSPSTISRTERSRGREGKRTPLLCGIEARKMMKSQMIWKVGVRSSNQIPHLFVYQLYETQFFSYLFCPAVQMSPLNFHISLFGATSPFTVLGIQLLPPHFPRSALTSTPVLMSLRYD